MIPKGMKVGDTFEDGGVMHKVLAVVGENYESIVIDEPKVFTIVEEPKKEVAEKKEEIAEDYLSMPYAQLKKLCADRGLDAKGSKADLIARLEK